MSTDDLAPRHLATSSTLGGALRQADLLAQQAHRQLLRNGEGHSAFWLRLVITNPDGLVVAWWASNGGYVRPSSQPPEPDPVPVAAVADVVFPAPGTPSSMPHPIV